MINDFSNGSVAWTDWNILLDQNGGPNHVGNFCFAPLHADTVTDELIYTPLIIILVISQNLFDRMLKNQRIQPQSIAYDFICEEDGKVITGSAIKR
jgi:glucosylceramidase